MDEESRTELLTEMKKLTELENPNPVAQMKDWLAQNGMPTESLGKKQVAALIKTAPPKLQKALLLRSQLAKSSVRKYQAMQSSACADGRVRGMFQFYGANRTGRWAGRLVQMQNLPQNHLPDLSEARALVKSTDYETVSMIYGNVPDTLSQLVRTAFIPKDECKFIVSDFSAIGARVIAWYAHEDWRDSNPNIVRFWWDVDRAVMEAVQYRSVRKTHGLTFTCKKGMLFITLPSGRNLAYVKPRIGENDFGNPCVTHEGITSGKKWDRINSYGPKFVENIVQATARDILSYAMQTLRCCRIVMHIHDELVIEADPATSLEAVAKQMSRTPPWAKGLILNADGYECSFYQKD